MDGALNEDAIHLENEPAIFDIIKYEFTNAKADGVQQITSYEVEIK
jgi:hypothetical protein